MDVYEAVMSRRAVRRFTDRGCPEGGAGARAVRCGLVAVRTRDGLMRVLDRTGHIRRQIGCRLEIISAVAIVAFGAWLLTMR
jgi:hypothetical protein